MSIAFHKNNDNKYVQYTVRIKEDILDAIREIAKKEEISINQVVNQSLQFAIDDYNKKK